MTKAEMKAILQNAVAELKKAAPDMPVMCVVAFPTDDPEISAICASSNVSPQDQTLMLLTLLTRQESDFHSSH